MTAQILDFSHPVPRRVARVEKKPELPETYQDPAIDDGMEEFRRLARMNVEERRAVIRTMIDTDGAVTPFQPVDLSEAQRHGRQDDPDTLADLEIPWWVWLLAYVAALTLCLSAAIWHVS